MEEPVFRKAIDGVLEMGGRFVPLAPMLGEPLIDPNIVQRVQYVLERGLNTSFFTNGILLHKIDLEALLRTGIRLITLSTAPFDRKAHELIYRTVHYDALLAGVTRLLELRNRLGADFVLAMAIKSHVPKREALHLPDFREKVWPLMTERERHLIHVQTRSYDTWGGQIREEELVGRMRVALPPRIKRRPCKWTFVPMIHWDGQVRACACRFAPIAPPDGRDGLFVGDLREAPLKEIWLGNRIRQLRRRFVSGDLPAVCRDCAMYQPC